MVGAGPAESLRAKKKGGGVLSRDGWQIRVKLLAEQQADTRENWFVFLFLLSLRFVLTKNLSCVRQVL